MCGYCSCNINSGGEKWFPLPGELDSYERRGRTNGNRFRAAMAISHQSPILTLATAIAEATRDVYAGGLQKRGDITQDPAVLLLVSKLARAVHLEHGTDYHAQCALRLEGL